MDRFWGRGGTEDNRSVAFSRDDDQLLSLNYENLCEIDYLKKIFSRDPAASYHEQDSVQEMDADGSNNQRGTVNIEDSWLLTPDIVEDVIVYGDDSYLGRDLLQRRMLKEISNLRKYEDPLSTLIMRQVYVFEHISKIILRRIRDRNDRFCEKGSIFLSGESRSAELPVRFLLDNTLPSLLSLMQRGNAQRAKLQTMQPMLSLVINALHLTSGSKGNEAMSKTSLNSLYSFFSDGLRPNTQNSDSSLDDEDEEIRVALCASYGVLSIGLLLSDPENVLLGLAHLMCRFVHISDRRDRLIHRLATATSEETNSLTTGAAVASIATGAKTDLRVLPGLEPVMSSKQSFRLQFKATTKPPIKPGDSIFKGVGANPASSPVREPASKTTSLKLPLKPNQDGGHIDRLAQTKTPPSWSSRLSMKAVVPVSTPLQMQLPDSSAKCSKLALPSKSRVLPVKNTQVSAIVGPLVSQVAARVAMAGDPDDPASQSTLAAAKAKLPFSNIIAPKTSPFTKSKKIDKGALYSGNRFGDDPEKKSDALTASLLEADVSSRDIQRILASSERLLWAPKAILHVLKAHHERKGAPTISSGAHMAEASLHQGNHSSVGDLTQVWSCGQNSYGELGHGDVNSRRDFESLSYFDGKSVTSIGAGNEHTAVVTSDGKLYISGYNDNGQCGNGSTLQVRQLAAVQTLSGEDVANVFVYNGCEHTLAVTRDGKLYSFGYNYRGQLGHGNTNSEPVPRLVKSLMSKRVVLAACSYHHSFVYCSDGSLYSFGRNDCGQLGHGDTIDKKTPHLVHRAPTPIQSLSCGQFHSVLATKIGAVYACGKNDYFQLSFENPESVKSFTRIRLATKNDISSVTGSSPVVDMQALLEDGGRDGVAQVCCGYYHTLMLASSGAVLAFGRNDYGQLGLGHTQPKISGCQVVYLLKDKNVTSVSAGCYHSIASTSNGMLYVFGRNNHGQLGTGDSEERHAPFPVDNFVGRRITSIAAGFYHTVVVTMARGDSGRDIDDQSEDGGIIDPAGSRARGTGAGEGDGADRKIAVVRQLLDAISDGGAHKMKSEDTSIIASFSLDDGSTFSSRRLLVLLIETLDMMSNVSLQAMYEKGLTVQGGSAAFSKEERSDPSMRSLMSRLTRLLQSFAGLVELCRGAMLEYTADVEDDLGLSQADMFVLIRTTIKIAKGTVKRNVLVFQRTYATVDAMRFDIKDIEEREFQESSDIIDCVDSSFTASATPARSRREVLSDIVVAVSSDSRSSLKAVNSDKRRESMEDNFMGVDDFLSLQSALARFRREILRTFFSLYSSQASNCNKTSVSVEASSPKEGDPSDGSFPQDCSTASPITSPAAPVPVVSEGKGISAALADSLVLATSSCIAACFDALFPTLLLRCGFLETLSSRIRSLVFDDFSSTVDARHISSSPIVAFSRSPSYRRSSEVPLGASSIEDQCERCLRLFSLLCFKFRDITSTINFFADSPARGIDIFRQILFVYHRLSLAGLERVSGLHSFSMSTKVPVGSLVRVTGILEHCCVNFAKCVLPLILEAASSNGDHSSSVSLEKHELGSSDVTGVGSSDNSFAVLKDVFLYSEEVLGFMAVNSVPDAFGSVFSYGTVITSVLPTTLLYCMNNSPMRLGHLASLSSSVESLIDKISAVVRRSCENDMMNAVSLSKALSQQSVTKSGSKRAAAQSQIDICATGQKATAATAAAAAAATSVAAPVAEVMTPAAELVTSMLGKEEISVSWAFKLLKTSVLLRARVAARFIFDPCRVDISSGGSPTTSSSSTSHPPVTDIVCHPLWAYLNYSETMDTMKSAELILAAPSITVKSSPLRTVTPVVYHLCGIWRLGQMKIDHSYRMLHALSKAKINSKPNNEEKNESYLEEIEAMVLDSVLSLQGINFVSSLYYSSLQRTVASSQGSKKALRTSDQIPVIDLTDQSFGRSTSHSKKIWSAISNLTKLIHGKRSQLMSHTVDLAWSDILASLHRAVSATHHLLTTTVPRWVTQGLLSSPSNSRHPVAGSSAIRRSFRRVFLFVACALRWKALAKNKLHLLGFQVVHFYALVLDEVTRSFSDVSCVHENWVRMTRRLEHGIHDAMRFVKGVDLFAGLLKQAVLPSLKSDIITAFTHVMHKRLQHEREEQEALGVFERSVRLRARLAAEIIPGIVGTTALQHSSHVTTKPSGSGILCCLCCQFSVADRLRSSMASLLKEIIAVLNAFHGIYEHSAASATSNELVLLSLAVKAVHFLCAVDMPRFPALPSMYYMLSRNMVGDGQSMATLMSRVIDMVSVLDDRSGYGLDVVSGIIDERSLAFRSRGNSRDRTRSLRRALNSFVYLIQALAIRETKVIGCQAWSMFMENDSQFIVNLFLNNHCDLFAVFQRARLSLSQVREREESERKRTTANEAGGAAATNGASSSDAIARTAGASDGLAVPPKYAHSKNARESIAKRRCQDIITKPMEFTRSQEGFVIHGDKLLNNYKGADFTLVFWVLIKKRGSCKQSFLTGKVSHSDSWPLVFICNEDSKLNVMFGHGNELVNLVSHAVIPLSSWTHVAVVVEPKKIKLFVNGSFDGHVITKGNTRATHYPVLVGSCPNGIRARVENIRDGFDGLISQYKYYTRALSTIHIRVIFDQGVPDTFDLRERWLYQLLASLTEISECVCHRVQIKREAIVTSGDAMLERDIEVLRKVAETVHMIFVSDATEATTISHRGGSSSDRLRFGCLRILQRILLLNVLSDFKLTSNDRLISASLPACPSQDDEISVLSAPSFFCDISSTEIRGQVFQIRLVHYWVRMLGLSWSPSFLSSLLSAEAVDKDKEKDKQKEGVEAGADINAYLTYIPAFLNPNCRRAGDAASNARFTSASTNTVVSSSALLNYANPNQILERRAALLSQISELNHNVVFLLRSLAADKAWADSVVRVVSVILHRVSELVLRKETMNNIEAHVATSTSAVGSSLSVHKPQLVAIDALGVAALLGEVVSEPHAGSAISSFFSSHIGKVLHVDNSTRHATILSWNSSRSNRQLLSVRLSDIQSATSLPKLSPLPQSVLAQLVELLDILESQASPLASDLLSIYCPDSVFQADVLLRSMRPLELLLFSHLLQFVASLVTDDNASSSDVEAVLSLIRPKKKLVQVIFKFCGQSLATTAPSILGLEVSNISGAASIQIHKLWMDCASILATFVSKPKIDMSPTQFERSMADFISKNLGLNMELFQGATYPNALKMTSFGEIILSAAAASIPAEEPNCPDTPEGDFDPIKPLSDALSLSTIQSSLTPSASLVSVAAASTTTKGNKDRSSTTSKGLIDLLTLFSVIKLNKESFVTAHDKYGALSSEATAALAAVTSSLSEDSEERPQALSEPLLVFFLFRTQIICNSRLLLVSGLFDADFLNVLPLSSKLMLLKNLRSPKSVQDELASKIKKVADTIVFDITLRPENTARVTDILAGSLKYAIAASGSPKMTSKGIMNATDLFSRIYSLALSWLKVNKDTSQESTVLCRLLDALLPVLSFHESTDVVLKVLSLTRQLLSVLCFKIMRGDAGISSEVCNLLRREGLLPLREKAHTFMLEQRGGSKYSHSKLTQVLFQLSSNFEILRRSVNIIQNMKVPLPPNQTLLSSLTTPNRSSTPSLCYTPSGAALREMKEATARPLIREVLSTSVIVDLTLCAFSLVEHLQLAKLSSSESASGAGESVTVELALTASIDGDDCVYETVYVGSVKTISHAGLSPGCTYKLKARALIANGSSSFAMDWSAPFEFKTEAGPRFTFDMAKCGADIILSEDKLTASYSGDDYWSTVLGSHSFTCGVSSWKVRVNQSSTAYIFVGVAAGLAELNNFLGGCPNGWGFIGEQSLYHNREKVKMYGEPFGAGDIIGVSLDLNAGTVSFSRNGKNLGIAFDNVFGELFPAVAFYNAGQELQLVFDGLLSSSPPQEPIPGCSSRLNVEEVGLLNELVFCLNARLPVPPRVLSLVTEHCNDWCSSAQIRCRTAANKSVFLNTSSVLLDKLSLVVGEKVRTPCGVAEVAGCAFHRVWFHIKNSGVVWFFSNQLIIKGKEKGYFLRSTYNECSRPTNLLGMSLAIGERGLSAGSMAAMGLVMSTPSQNNDAGSLGASRTDYVYSTPTTKGSPVRRTPGASASSLPSGTSDSISGDSMLLYEVSSMQDLLDASKWSEDMDAALVAFIIKKSDDHDVSAFSMASVMVSEDFRVLQQQLSRLVMASSDLSHRWGISGPKRRAVIARLSLLRFLNHLADHYLPALSLDAKTDSEGKLLRLADYHGTVPRIFGTGSSAPEEFPNPKIVTLHNASKLPTSSIENDSISSIVEFRKESGSKAEFKSIQNTEELLISLSWFPKSFAYLDSQLGPLSLSRRRIFTEIKTSHFWDIVTRTSCRTAKTDDDYDYPENLPQVKVNRMKSFRAREAAEILGVNAEDLLQSSIFYQLWQELTKDSLSGSLGGAAERAAEAMRISYTHPMDDGQSRAFKIRFEGEGVDDYGGPYREIFQQICDELTRPDPAHLAVLNKKTAGEEVQSGGASITAESRNTAASFFSGRREQDSMGDLLPVRCFLPMLLPTCNWTAGECAERYRYTFYPGKISPLRQQLYQFLGQLVGIAIRSKITLDLLLPSCIWKSVVREPLSERDIASFDAPASQFIQLLGSLYVKYNQEEESLQTRQELAEEIKSHLIDLSWTFRRVDGHVVELVPRGAEKPVAFEDLEQYLRLYTEARLVESACAVASFRKGFLSVIPEDAIATLTGQELEKIVCGSSYIDVLRLRGNTEYDDDISPSDPHILNFWDVLSGFSEDEKSLFLRFVWARPTLPPKGVEFPQKFKIQSPSSEDTNLKTDQYLPKAHTCFFSLLLPKYSTKELMAEKLRYAIFNCTEMDADFKMTDAKIAGWGGVL